MAPGILAIIILFTVAGIESLETPLALGRPGGIEVMATRVYDLLQPATGVGFAYGPPAALGLLGLLSAWSASRSTCTSPAAPRSTWC